jgi:hypothetical protein
MRIALLLSGVKRKTHHILEAAQMSGTRFTVAVAISLAGFLLPTKSAASDRPTLISHVTSPPVRDMPPQAHRNGPPDEKPVRRPAAHRNSGDVADPVVQTSTTRAASAQALGQWEGLGAGYPGYSITAVPPDPNMAVGPNHIVQWVNNAFVVFDKSGGVVSPPVSDDTFWGGLSGTCDQLGGYSDPIVQYDRSADRWIVGEVAIPGLPGLLGQFAQCFAVSKTSDPTGAYNQWAYGFGTTVPDYPKIGMWPDGYYVTWNLFESGGTAFRGAETCAWDRVGMLSGVAAPKFVCFSLTSAYSSLLPSDFDGALPPPGSPNFLMNIDPGSSALNLWKFHVDFTTPGNSTLDGPVSIPGTAPFVAPCPGTQDCIPQPATTESLDALGDRLMYRLAYRNFGDHESIVANHTVVAGSGATGVRWYEVRNPNSAPTIYQQGTFAPDADNRWMASIAMDRTGNIGVGYSLASGGTFPSIRYTGWEVGDPLGTLQDETFFVAGGGSQTGYNRWGDYSAMRIDPNDDCTFWYTQEYQASTQVVGWSTRIGSFRFASCSQSQASTTTTVASSLPSSTFGQQVTFTATISPPSGPTGTVTFLDGVNSLGIVALSGGTASVTTSALAVGTHFITASYSGDATFTGSTSASLAQTVYAGTVNTTTTLTSSLKPSAYGQPVMFSATVTPSSGASGTVIFMDGASTLGTSALNASGVATWSTSSLAVGTHFITAQYSGDGSHSSSTSSPLAQTVNKAGTTTTLTSNSNPSKGGSPVTFTATVSVSSATGSVQFFDGSTSLGAVPLSSGKASLTTTFGGGKHSITAVYSGDGNFAGSTSAVLSQTVTGKK